MRACGVFLPEFVLVESYLPSFVEAEYEELDIVRPEMVVPEVS